MTRARFSGGVSAQAGQRRLGGRDGGVDLGRASTAAARPICSPVAGLKTGATRPSADGSTLAADGVGDALASVVSSAARQSQAS